VTPANAVYGSVVTKNNSKSKVALRRPDSHVSLSKPIKKNSLTSCCDDIPCPVVVAMRWKYPRTFPNCIIRLRFVIRRGDYMSHMSEISFAENVSELKIHTYIHTHAQHTYLHTYLHTYIQCMYMYTPKLLSYELYLQT
jgi:hypothetical protein